jgi:DNA-directed RNA polymerase subunit beta
MGVGTNQEIIDLFGDEDVLQATFKKDSGNSVDDGAYRDIQATPAGEPPTVESAKMLIDHCSLTREGTTSRAVGRYK